MDDAALMGGFELCSDRPGDGQGFVDPAQKLRAIFCSPRRDSASYRAPDTLQIVIVLSQRSN